VVQALSQKEIAKGGPLKIVESRPEHVITKKKVL